MDQNKIKEFLDADEGLTSKRKILIILSMLLIAIQQLGIKIIEANTVIFKIQFTESANLKSLLVVSIFYMMIRYYNYASPYHDALRKLWIERLLKEGTFIQVYEDMCPGDEPAGIIGDYAPLEYRKSSAGAAQGFIHMMTSFEYKPGVFPSIVYYWTDEYRDNEREIKITKLLIKDRKYLKVQCLETKYQINAVLKYRENLDLLGPYIISLIGIINGLV